MIRKNITAILCLILLSLGASNKANSTEECFEGLSRAVFKFNMAFDDVVLEPIAKGYNKLPKPIRKGSNNFTSNISTLLYTKFFIARKFSTSWSLYWKFSHKFNCRCTWNF